MIATNIAESAEKVLLKYLAPEAAKTAAQEVADASAAGLSHEIAGALAGLLGGPVPEATPSKKPGSTPAKKPAAAAAPKTPAKKPAVPATGSGRVLTEQARKVMSFKKAVYHATNRAKAKKPEPWDTLVLKAASEGKIISVDWAKKTALAAQKREQKAGSNGHGKKAPAPAKKADKKADPPKKAANGTSAGLAESAPL